jgi:hypothetical protein
MLKNIEYKCVKSETIHRRAKLKCIEKQEKTSGVGATSNCGLWFAMKLIHLHFKLGRFQT